MIQKLIEYFSSIKPISSEERNAIIASASIKTFPKDTILLKEGEIAKDTYFVLNGCIRQYMLIDGVEKTNHFFTEAQWVLSANSLINQIPADHFFSCTEETTLVIGNENDENQLFVQFPRLESISRKVVEKIFAEHQLLNTNYYTDSPEQRYLRLLETRPSLFQRVPQYQLASYIGVTPESLSRIRKRIAQKNQL